MNLRLKKLLNSFKDNWFFIRQDIVSYSISTLLYITLCLIRTFTIQSALYGLFDCLVFYIPFWYIRINFADTYHSNNWNHCKMWTRIMLCSGVIALFLLPLPYSLFNGLFVAFVCCLVLYLVALETNEKKSILKENKKLQREISKLLKVEKDPKQELLNRCREAKLNDRDTKLAVMYYYERKTPKDIWLWYCQQKEYDPVEWNIIYQALWRIGKKLKNK